MVFDYYNMAGYNEIMEAFFRDLSEEVFKEKKLSLTPRAFYDLYYCFLELLEKGSSLGKKYEINTDAYLYFLLKRYAKYLSNPLKRRLLLSNPYITGYSLSGEKRYIMSIFGSADFSLFIPNKKTYGNLPEDIRKYYKDIYYGKSQGRCHEYAVTFCRGFNVITAFLPEVITGLSYLHSYLEKDGEIIDISSNIVMKKDDFDGLIHPEVVSEISGDELYETHYQLNQYPNLKNLGLKQKLVEYYDIIRDPEGVKVRTFEK